MVAWPWASQARKLPGAMADLSEAHTLLVVEDDDVLRERLVRAFHDRGFLAQGAASLDEARLRSEDAPEYAVVDLRVGEASGLEVLKALLAKDPATRVVMLT